MTDMITKEKIRAAIALVAYMIRTERLPDKIDAKSMGVGTFSIHGSLEDGQLRQVRLDTSSLEGELDSSQFELTLDDRVDMRFEKSGRELYRAWDDDEVEYRDFELSSTDELSFSSEEAQYIVQFY